MMKFAHFDPATGFIRQVSSRPFAIDGLGVAEVLCDFAIDPDQWKVDLASVADVPNDARFYHEISDHELDDLPSARRVCRIIPRPEGERLVLPIATLGGMKIQRERALKAADEWMMPHRPVDPELRGRWDRYMQALRDLGKHQLVADFVAAWPMRPDGQDDIAEIRAAFLSRKQRKG